MDNLQEKIEIPKVEYQGDDKKLKERIFKFKTGSLRIAIFTIVGFVAGFFSRTYTQDSFLPTKLILAIPYKINEAIYCSILGTDAATTRYWEWPPGYTDFFPRSWLATFFAEVVTTILISGAIYGSLAYFTGDKRVFTLERYLKFAACWCAVILLSIGGAYGINAKAVSDNERLDGIERIYLTTVGDGYSGSGVLGNDVTEQLLELFYDDLEEISVVRNPEEEIPINFDFSWGRETECRINCKECYLVTERGRIYRVPEVFASVVYQCYITGELPESIEDVVDIEDAAGIDAAAGIDDAAGVQGEGETR